MAAGAEKGYQGPPLMGAPMRGLALLLIVVIVLSGCSSKTDTSSTPPSSTGTRSTTSPGTGGGGGGTITVTLNRTTADGDIPLKVNFTLDATFKDASGKATHPTSSIAVTYRHTQDANGTAITATAENGPSINSLPNSFSLTFEKAGKYEVVASVKSKDYKDGQATIIILPRVPGGTTGSDPSAGAIFFDGGEGDTSQWTIASTVLAADPVGGCNLAKDTGAPFATGEKWGLATDQARTGGASWHVAYKDNIHSVMTSVSVDVPAAGGHLSFAFRGGVEANCADGLHILAGPAAASLTELEFLQAVSDSWSTRSYPLPAGATVISFQFDADVSCSDDSGAPPGGVLTCGDGFDKGGYWLDDIAVV